MLDQHTDSESFDRALELAKRFAQRTEPALVDTLGWAYYRTGDYANAVRYLEIATSGGKQLAQLRYHLGMAYLKQNNPLRAREELEASLELAETEFIGIEDARAALKTLQN